MPSSRRILVIHGPTLSKLGTREPDVYGTRTLAQIDAMLVDSGNALEACVESRQTHHEGQIIDWLLDAAPTHDGVLLNAGGYSHTSVAIHDAIRACGVPVVEVHLSNVHAREDFRRELLTARACIGTVSGFGARSYTLGLRALIEYLNDANSA